MNPTPTDSSNGDDIDGNESVLQQPEVGQEKPKKQGKKKGPRNVLDPPQEFHVVVTMNRKHVKRLGKAEYKKVMKLLFKDDAVHHVDVAMNDGGVVRFVR